MRQKVFWVAARCILALAGLLPVFSSGASPASKEKVIYSFQGGSDGSAPMSDLTLDAAGNLYGTTVSGGTGTACQAGCGTVFELTRELSGWKKHVLYNFAGGTDAAYPGGGVIFDVAGNLYGVADGGKNFGGTAFKLAPDIHGEWRETVIYNFECCASPQGDLVFDSSGNLYGTTPTGVGGTCFDEGCGAVFKLSPHADGTWTETTLYSFTDVPDAGVPSGGVVVDPVGNVYGLTTYGGSSICRPGENKWFEHRLRNPLQAQLQA
jgi:hypothetical protein